MRLCYLADAESIHTQRWLSYFADKGHEVHLLSLNSFGDYNIENVDLHPLKRLRPQIRDISFPINLLSDTIQVRKVIKKIKPDIVHAHFVANYGVLGALSGFHPFVVSAWGSDVLIAPKNSRIIKNLVKFTLKKADLVTCDGENSIDALIKLGEKLQKIKIILLGVDTKEFNPNQRDKKVREELKIFDPPTVISVRNFDEVYDVESLIKAIPLVLKQVPNAKFIIGGSGSQESYLKELAKSLGVWNSVRFTGWLPRNEFVKCLASADIYVSTSLSDGGIAVSTSEAMACGLPVVVTNSGDNRKWIREGENGFVVPIRDPDTLAEKIIYLLENEDVRKRFGNINRRIIKEKVDYEKNMKKMEELYKSVLR